MTLSFPQIIEQAKSSPQTGQARLVDAKQKLAQAQGTSVFIQKIGEQTSPQGALAPLTFCVKDCFYLSGYTPKLGLRTSPLREGQPSTLITEIEALGATLLGVTNMDELGCAYYGFNAAYGDAPNTLGADLIGGGSCAGAAAAIALDLADFAVGADFAGSARIPAACQGLSAFRPSSDILPVEGVFLLAKEFDCPAFIAKMPGDLKFLWEALGHAAGPDATAGIIVVPPSFCLSQLDRPTLLAWHNILDLLRQHFEVREIGTELDLLAAHNCFKVLAAVVFAKALAGLSLEPDLWPQTAQALFRFAQLKRYDAPQALRQSEELHKGFKQALGADAIFVSPALSSFPPSRAEAKSGAFNPKLSFNVFLTLANLFGCPAVTFPCAGIPWGTNVKIPFSLQIIGPHGSDSALLSLASALTQ